MLQSSRSVRAVVTITVVTGAVLLGACTEESSGASWVDQARVSNSEPPHDGDAIALPATVGCEPLGIDDPVGGEVPPAGAPSGVVDSGSGNDPYTATGARQLPGPDMARVAPPSEPVSIVVARPVDPDEHVAARQPEGHDTGPVPPSRYTPGRSSPNSTGSPPTTADTQDSSDTQPSSETEPSPSAAAAPCVPMVGP